MSMTRSDETEINAAQATSPAKVSLKAAWEVIDNARRARITGELALTTASPAKTKIYLDSGRVYFAERETDESLATRLVLAGAIDPDQLHRGSLRLNGVEHLGRLFERDDTVERDAVELALELMTEQTLTEVAEHEVLSSQITMYRQHSSGVARWFMAPHTAHSADDTDNTSEVSSQRPSPWQPPSSPPVDSSAHAHNGNVFEVDEPTEPHALPTLPPPSAVTVNRLVPRPPVNRLAQAVAAPLSLAPQTETSADQAGASDDSVTDEVTDAVTDEVTDEVTDAVTDVANEAVETVETVGGVEAAEADVSTDVPTQEPTETVEAVEVVEAVDTVELPVQVVEAAKVSTLSGLQSMKPLASLKSFMPITATAQPIASATQEADHTDQTDVADLANLVSAVAQESDVVPATDSTVVPQKAPISTLQAMTLKPMAPLQPMTPLQPMNLQQLTPHVSTPAMPSTNVSANASSSTTGPVPVTASRFTKPNDPDLSNIPVPEEVAAAVRRAIEAIENAMHEPRAADVTFGPMHVTAPGQPSPMAAAAAAAYDEPLGAPHVNGFSTQSGVAAEMIAQTNGEKSEKVMSFGELSSDGAVYPLPVLPPLAPRGKRAPVSEQRKGALRRLIAGVRRR
jgi:hypothetical protein